MENYNGDIKDPRSEEEKAQDYKHSDLGFGVAVEWKKKQVTELKNYTKRFQSTSLSCGPQSGAKAIETLISEVMSARPPYIGRANFPEGGMWIQDLGNVFKKIGTNLEKLYPSQNMGEAEIDVKLDISTPYKIKGYLQPNCRNIDEIAQAIENFKHCVLLFHFNGNDWTARPEVSDKINNSGHFITAIDYFLDENGVKCLYIEDSALPSTTLDGQHRYITEDFLKAKCDGAIYFLGVNPLEIPFTFTKTLKIGSIGFDVKKLQTLLGGLVVDGKFGKNTENSVKAFQLVHGLSADGIVGPLTNKKLNEL